MHITHFIIHSFVVGHSVYICLWATGNNAEPMTNNLMKIPVFIILRHGLSMYPWLSWNLLCRPGWFPAHKDPSASVCEGEVKGVHHHIQCFL